MTRRGPVGPFAKAALAAATTLAIVCTAVAQQADEPPTTLSGTLQKANASGAVTIGYREASIPFSFLPTGSGEPIGYSIDLCRAIVDAIAESVGKPIAVRWQAVTSESRIPAVAAGRVDLECGSTTSNLERRKQVAFSPIIFVSGTKLMVPKGSSIASFRDLAGKRVVTTAGTTNAAALETLKRRFGVDVTLVSAPDHAASYAMLADGRVDAFATDDVLLYGFLAQNRSQARFQVVGDLLSYEPYGVMVRKDDPQLAKLVEDTFARLATDGEIERRYTRWFLQKLPSGISLDLPMSPQLETAVQAMAARMP